MTHEILVFVAGAVAGGAVVYVYKTFIAAKVSAVTTVASAVASDVKKL
jgi:uncharacterized membrane protein